MNLLLDDEGTTWSEDDYLSVPPRHRDEARRIFALKAAWAFAATPKDALKFARMVEDYLRGEAAPQLKVVGGGISQEPV